MSPSKTAARPRRPRKTAATGTVASPNGSAQDRNEKDADTIEITRLTVNLNAETAAALNEIAAKRGISLTETVRRAVAVLKFVEDEIQKGNAVQSTDGARTRELLLVY